MSNQQPFRLYKEMIDTIVLEIWKDTSITRKSQVKNLMTGNLTELTTITGYPISELQTLLKNWNVNTTRQIKSAWKTLNDNYDIDNPDNTVNRQDDGIDAYVTKNMALIGKALVDNRGFSPEFAKAEIKRIAEEL